MEENVNDDGIDCAKELERWLIMLDTIELQVNDLNSGLKELNKNLKIEILKKGRGL